MSIKIKKLISNGSYCALPFVHHYLNLDGYRYLCCYSDIKLTSVDDLKNIQNKIINGEKVETCSRCYNWENQGSVSPRIKETIGLLKNNRISSILEKSIDDLTQATVLSYDIRFSNRCNLACIGCNPKDSSLWARQTKTVIEINQHDNLDFEQVSSSEKIYFAGGEPLINDKVYRLLSMIGDNDYQPEIVINSNIASIKPKFYDVFKKIKKLSITVSFDGAGSINEYHRWPLQWNKFLDNLTAINQMGIHVSWNTVLDSVSVWGVKSMLTLESLTQDWNIRVLQGPPHLRLRNLNQSLKASAHDQIEFLKNSKFYQSDPVFRTRIELALNELNQPGNPEDLADIIRNLDYQRKLNHQIYLGVNLT